MSLGVRLNDAIISPNMPRDEKLIPVGTPCIGAFLDVNTLGECSFFEIPLWPDFASRGVPISLVLPASEADGFLCLESVSVLPKLTVGQGSGFRSTWNLYGGRLLFDLALAMPSILAGRMYLATSVMASTALVMTAFNWAADAWIDRW